MMDLIKNILCIAWDFELKFVVIKKPMVTSY